MEKILLTNIRIFNMKYIIFSIFLIQNIFACAVCYGAPEHPVTEGMNNGILFLLTIVVFVLSSIAASIFVLVKRARAYEIEGGVK
tara:strand:+ start:101 stop:355 length:255 start_codon:yes stop_codon:yes gene_type:complete